MPIGRAELTVGLVPQGGPDWIAGVIYDSAGFYAPAFATGIVANLAHLCLVAALALQWRRLSDRPALGRAAA